MEIVVKEVSPIEFVTEEKRIRDSHTSVVEVQQSWKSLDSFFHTLRPDQDQKYKWTYFRLYVDLSWKLFGSLDGDMVANVVFARQIPMAIMLDIDVLPSLMWYLTPQLPVKQDLQILYQKIKTAFFESEQIIGSWLGKDVMVKDLISEYLILHKRGASSMEGAEFLSKLKQMMFPKEANPHIFVDFDEGVDRFLELIQFFQETNNEKIWFVVDAFLNPERYNKNNVSSQNVVSRAVDEKVGVPKIEVLDTSTPFPQNLANKYESMSQKLDAEIRASESSVVPTVPVVKVEPEKPVVAKPAPKEAPAVEVPVKLSAAQTSVVEPQVRLTTGQIKSQIESEFKQDLDGNFENIEGVMRKLEEFAEMYNDPKIADMIYYDEEDDKFKWKV